ncbi:MAG: hypothetical protein J6V42_06205 [Clostridia bacterium]|nr:hypothetical protein [Clostridia bacterium]
MKRILALIIALSMLLLAGCQVKTPEPQTPKTPEEAREILYNWLVENGELRDGTDLLYFSGDFFIKTSVSKKIEVFYSKGNVGNYTVSFSLPLLSNEKNVTLLITLKKSIDTYIFECIHTPETFQKNIPLTYEKLSSTNTNRGDNKIAKDFAQECSHTALAEILEWLENTVCKPAGLTLSDLGYKAYK